MAEFNIYDLVLRGGLALEVGVDGFRVFFCGGGWTWRIVWQLY